MTCSDVRPGQMWRYRDSGGHYIVMVIREIGVNGRRRSYATQVIWNGRETPDMHAVGDYRLNYWPDSGWELIVDV